MKNKFTKIRFYISLLVSNSQGLTLMELLVGIAISGMLLLMTTGMMLMMFESGGRVKQLDQLEQNKNDIQVELSNNIRWAEKITITAISPTQDNITINDEIEYLLVDEQLFKKDLLTGDQQLLTDDQIKITSMLVQDYSLKTGVDALKSLVVNFDLVHSKFPSMQQNMRLVVSQRDITIEVP